MNGVLLALYRHKTWATLRLIEFCQGLGDEHPLAAAAPTSDTTRRAILHQLGREEGGYCWTVRQDRLSEPLPDAPAPLGELAERIRLSLRWEALARETDLLDRPVISRD